MFCKIVFFVVVVFGMLLGVVFVVGGVVEVMDFDFLFEGLFGSYD